MNTRVRACVFATAQLRLFFLLLGLCALTGSGRSLEVVDTHARLPVALANHAAVYDGDDSIYIVGGYNGTYLDSVFKYSLQSGLVEEFKTLAPLAFGMAVYHEDQIFYFGGHGPDERSSAVYSFSTITNASKRVVGHLPWAMQAAALAWDPREEVAYLFGGYGSDSPPEMDHILAFNVSSCAVAHLGMLPRAVAGAAGVWNPGVGVAHVFGGLPGSTHDVLRYNPATNSIAEPSSSLPTAVAYACAAFDERNGFVYVVGGHAEQSNDLIRYSPGDGRSETLRADSWPRALNYPACVYVHSLDRIYIVGGYGSLAGEPSAYRNEILYLGLSPSPTGPNRALFFVLVVGLPLIAVVTLVAFVLRHYKLLLGFRRRGRGSKSDDSISLGAGLSPEEIREFQAGTIDHEFSSSSYLNAGAVYCRLPYDRKYELQEATILIDRRRVLGSGQFGVVYLGSEVGTGRPVAVKTVQPHNTNKVYVKALLSELKVLTHLGPHPHVANLVGATTTGLRRGAVFLYLEFCALGDLESFLRKRKNCFAYCYSVDGDGKSSTGAPPLSTATPPSSSGSGQYVHPYELSLVTTCDLFLWSVQTASAMEFLASKKVIHGDLAVRNILLLDKSCAKITDFGLARKLYNYTNYKKTEDTPLPWRSLAPESLRAMTFNSQSDVWSFGVMLWEVFSLGEVPYSAGTQFSLDFVASLQEGARLPRPEHAPETLYDEMLRCWSLQPEERPTFAELRSALEALQAEEGAELTESCTYF